MSAAPAQLLPGTLDLLILKAVSLELTTSGRKRLREETHDWNRLAEAIGAALAASPEDL